MKLKREGSGQYVTEDGRYRIERTDDNLTECQHPLCDRLHEKWVEEDMHLVAYTQWHVWDTVKDDYAGGHETFETKRDAVAWLETHLAKRPPAERAADLGHICVDDPGMSGERWTCVTCGRAVLRVNGNVYGSAIEIECSSKKVGF